MNIQNYLEKLRAKPVHERQRIAVIATAVGFAMILAIWLVSFNEMNKPTETQADPASANLNDLKNDFQNNLQTGKDSIQNMMQELPVSPAGTDVTGAVLNSDNLNIQDNNQQNTNLPQLP